MKGRSDMELIICLSIIGLYLFASVVEKLAKEYRAYEEKKLKQIIEEYRRRKREKNHS